MLGRILHCSLNVECHGDFAVYEKASEQLERVWEGGEDVRAEGVVFGMPAFIILRPVLAIGIVFLGCWVGDAGYRRQKIGSTSYPDRNIISPPKAPSTPIHSLSLRVSILRLNPPTTPLPHIS